MAFWNLAGGLRVIPSQVTASGEPYNVALHSLLEHNQELISNTILSRQLVNDYYPDAATTPHLELARPKGDMVAQWGRFEHSPGMEIVCKIHAAKCTTTYSDDTDLHLVSTPKFISPLTPLDHIVSAYATEALYYDYVTIDSTSWQYWDLSLRPNRARGDFFYLSLWKSSDHATNFSEAYLRLVSIWEQPESS